MKTSYKSAMPNMIRSLSSLEYLGRDTMAILPEDKLRKRLKTRSKSADDDVKDWVKNVFERGLINEVDVNETFLMLAAYSSDTKAIKEILKYNPDLTIRSGIDGKTALDIAADREDKKGFHLIKDYMESKELSSSNNRMSAVEEMMGLTR